MRGDPAAETVLSGTFETGLRTVSACARVTRPWVRTSTRSAFPTHTGAPSLQPRVVRDSRLSRSGASPSSSTTCCHAVQRPPAGFVRRSSVPGPRQWIPISWNGCSGPLALSVRSLPSGSSRTSSEASPAAA